MNRKSLESVLERHMPTFAPGPNVIFCNCGREFTYRAEWSRHVSDAIYPRS